LLLPQKNPYEEFGTFQLPLSQLDRFTSSITLGHPEHSIERQILKNTDSQTKKLDKIISIKQLVEIQKLIPMIILSEPLLDEIQDIIAHTRQKEYFLSGISTRGAISLVRLLQAYAFLQGRDYVKPEDIKDTLESVLRHRIINKEGKPLENEDIKKFYEKSNRTY
jgi:MoxR-like ATPase